MPRSLKIAAVQMFAQTAPVAERLERADSLIAEAASSGAQLIVLPEVFNTGYEYSSENYGLAEAIDGNTVQWMKKTATNYQIHLAGTLYLRDEEDIHNALILVAPDGRLWRYNKNYPWYMERAFFREGSDITIAETALGDLGLLICWDAMHPELWSRYAGKIDAMVVCSCPPSMHDISIILPDGKQVQSEEVGLIWRYIKNTSGNAFSSFLRRQAVAMNLPVVNTTGTGTLKTSIPSPYVMYGLYTATRPDLWKHLPQAKQVEIETGYFNETYIADATGKVISQVPSEQEGFVIAEITLPDEKPQSQKRQPRFGLSILAYLADNLVNALMVPVYRHGIRNEYGKHMAPIQPQTKIWLGIVGMASIVSGLVGYLRGYFKRNQ